MLPASTVLEESDPKVRKPGLILTLELSLHPWANNSSEVHFQQLVNEAHKEQHIQLRPVMRTGEQRDGCGYGLKAGDAINSELLKCYCRSLLVEHQSVTISK